MNEPRDPVALSRDARELAGRMQDDPTFQLDIAYQVLRGREQIEELQAELERERRRVDACVRAMRPNDPDGSLRGVLQRAIPPLAFFVAGMIALAVCLLLLDGQGSFVSS
jgi:acyl transferase domain-containing protein